MTKSPEPSEGLRSRKKAQQRADLLKVATKLLRERGYEETRIEDIAHAADVSLKTVYNYFPSKQDILIELLRDDRKRMLGAYEAVVNRPSDDLAKDLSLLMRADIGDVVTPRSKKLWRELLAAETRSHTKPGDEFDQNRKVFTEFLRRLLIHFRTTGVLAEKVNIDAATDMIYGIMAYNFRQYCATDSMTPAEYFRTTKKQMTLLLTNWINS